MPAVNQFNGFGGTPGFNNWPNMAQSYTAVPSKPLYDPSRPNGDCLKQVNGVRIQLGWRAQPLLGGY